ncbi:hypothetical protein BJX76DRAFT_361787 [Aspergillus varians]
MSSAGGRGGSYQEYLKVAAIVRNHSVQSKLCHLALTLATPQSVGQDKWAVPRVLIRATELAAGSGFVVLEISGGNGVVKLAVAARLGICWSTEDVSSRLRAGNHKYRLFHIVNRSGNRPGEHRRQSEEPFLVKERPRRSNGAHGRSQSTG